MGNRNETGYVKNITDEEINRILEYLNNYKYNNNIIRIKWLLLFSILAFMGLRISEVIRLKKENVVKDDTLRFTTLKTNMIIERYIPLKVQDLLLPYLKVCRSMYLFSPDNKSNSKNEHIKASTIRWRLKQIRDNLKLTDNYYVTKNNMKLHRISLHTFRHYHISKLWEVSKDIKLISNIIGHKRYETTYKYIYTMDKFQREKTLMEKI